MASRKSRLAPSKHHLQAPNDPPIELGESQYIARVTKLHGNSLYTVGLPSKIELLVELPMRFRNAVWVRRGGYVLIETKGLTERKVNGDIMEVILDEKEWKKMSYWYILCLSMLSYRPQEFKEKEQSANESIEESDVDEEGNVPIKDV